MPRIFSTFRLGVFAAAVVLRWVTVSSAAGSDGTAANRLGIKFDPAAHAAAVAATTREGPHDGSDSAAESDDLLHLEKVVVEGHRPPFKARDVLTPGGKVDLAKQTHLTPAYEKTFGIVSTLASYVTNPLSMLGGWHPNNADAMALYEDIAQKRRNSEMADLESLAALAEPDVAKLPAAKPLERTRRAPGRGNQGGATP